ncbi:MAG: methyltransferase [Proteobacteria bacterium]|nr:methyltransferase [Pseudomonadota bacterium]HQR03039.1 CmcJ/NvfI family oxidoreductase [Rhodocyclaceae bacterium]
MQYAHATLPQAEPLPASHVAVRAGLAYLQPMSARPFTHMYPAPAGIPQQNCEFALELCEITNARSAWCDLSLNVNGFDLIELSTKVLDFDDMPAIHDTYYPEIAEAAKNLMDGRRALIFDHQIRQREPGRPVLDFGRTNGSGRVSPLGRVHNDYSHGSATRRLRAVLPDADPDQPFAILNFWRPLLHPAIDAPLAVCDARTVAAEEAVISDIIYPDRIGEIFLYTWSPAHNWYYYPAMMPGEVLVFKSYDSRIDAVARMTPHSAFDSPLSQGDTPPRRSIEVRCLVLLD